MPIKIPDGLPAARTLASENIFVMGETRAVTQDIRPLHILVLNLMPTKIETETQLSRLLGNTPLQVAERGLKKPRVLAVFLRPTAEAACQLAQHLHEQFIYSEAVRLALPRTAAAQDLRPLCA